MVDAADPDHEQQMAAVERILQDLGSGETPRLLVCNKIDRLAEEDRQRLLSAREGVAVSAREPGSLGPLLRAIENALFLN